MKRINLGVVCILLFVLADYTQANLQDGLVAYYPFSGNANDYSGIGNHGTVFGATLATDRFGNLNHAYSFDGIDDYIATPVIIDQAEESVPSDQILIKAEPSRDNEQCKFMVNCPLFEGHSWLFSNFEEAAGSPLAESVFSVDSVHVKVCKL